MTHYAGSVGPEHGYAGADRGTWSLTNTLQVA